MTPNPHLSEYRDLRTTLTELFNREVETALFYFSGHGYVDDLSGYLITSECCFGDDGSSPAFNLLENIS